MAVYPQITDFNFLMFQIKLNYRNDNQCNIHLEGICFFQAMRYKKLIDNLFCQGAHSELGGEAYAQIIL